MFTVIELDKARNLRYGIKAIALIERKLGKNIGRVDERNLTIDEKMVFLWAGIYHEDITITPEKLLDIIEEKNISMTYVMEKIGEAIADSLPGDTENPTQAAAE